MLSGKTLATVRFDNEEAANMKTSLKHTETSWELLRDLQAPKVSLPGKDAVRTHMRNNVLPKKLERKNFGEEAGSCLAADIKEVVELTMRRFPDPMKRKVLGINQQGQEARPSAKMTTRSSGVLRGAAAIKPVRAATGGIRPIAASAIRAVQATGA